MEVVVGVTYIEKFLGFRYEFGAFLGALDLLAWLCVGSLIGKAKELTETGNLSLPLLFQQIADLLKLVNAVVRAVCHYVIHHIHNMLV